MKNLAWLAVILLGACSISASGDDKDDSFTSGGKADGAIAEGSPEALGVLRVANELKVGQLGGVGVDERAENAIFMYRMGSPYISGDERWIETLAELDAIDYVGPQTFDTLLAAAQARGYMNSPPEFTPLHCPRLSYAKLVALSTGNAVGSGSVHTRQRDTCTNTECTDWHDGSIPLVQDETVGSVPYGTQYTLPATATASIVTKPDGDLDFIATSGDVVVWCSRIAYRGGWNSESAGPDAGLWCGPIVKFGDASSPLSYDWRVPPSTTWREDRDFVFGGTICDDGRFQLISHVGADLEEYARLKNTLNNLHQIAIEGTFPHLP